MSAPALFQPPRTEMPPNPEVQPVCVRRVSVPEGYRLWAATYDEDPNPLLALEDRELASRLPGVRGRSVLDVGCGTGRWLRRFASNAVRTAVGVDLSAAMLKRAARRPDIGQRLIRADCLALPVRSCVADLILCSFTIGHVRSLDALAREISRVALPGADVFLTDLHPQAQASGWRVGFRFEGAPIEVEAYLHSREEIRQSFELCGLGLIDWWDLQLAESEREIFARAGRDAMFETACAMPAVLLCHFKRN